VFLLLTLLLAGTPPAADLLLEGGTVYLAADARSQKASIAIDDGRIVFIGDSAKAAKLVPGARVVDLKGAFVFPGFADAHLHLLGIGKGLETANLRGAADAAAAATRVAEAAAKLPPGAWAEGRGWDQNLWPGKQFPDARDLDAVLPDRPAAARRVDGHALWVNTAALKAARIDASTKDPDGGRILRRADGSPSGVLVDNAMELAVKAMPEATSADRERWLAAGANACARVGLTEVQDASGYDADGIAALEHLASRGALPIRVYATVSPDPAQLTAFLAKGARIGGGPDFLTVRAIKAYADGALGSRGAALLEDYSDEPGHRGLLLTPPERLAAVALEARKAGWQLWVHAIGDRGNRIVLDAYQSAASAAPSAPEGGQRPRIEHAQVIAPDDFPRFARIGVIASIQPTHATSDMVWAEARLGPSRIDGAYAWLRLKNAGARLAGGSDAPVESENPIEGLYAALTRQDASGRPPGGWRVDQALSRAEAVALFTSDAAYAAFEEKWRGKIAAGAAGDLTVLSGDPLTVPAEKILAIRPVLTVVGGRVVYEAAAP
jgi:predicted amidohydrolase YtcJ